MMTIFDTPRTLSVSLLLALGVSLGCATKEADEPGIDVAGSDSTTAATVGAAESSGEAETAAGDGGTCAASGESCVATACCGGLVCIAGRVCGDDDAGTAGDSGGSDAAGTDTGGGSDDGGSDGASSGGVACVQEFSDCSNAPCCGDLICHTGDLGMMCAQSDGGGDGEGGGSGGDGDGGGSGGGDGDGDGA